jgi:pimeloyl-ACP methyl ester carboxylesterase
MRRTFLTWLTDRLILCPTRHPIEATGKTPRLVPWSGGQLEIWTQRVGGDPAAAADLYVLKFPGTAGRAERSTIHPADAWPGLSVELWTVNPPGYGGSSGTASLRTTAAVADAVLEQFQTQAAGRPLIITGTSLGCVSALYLGARHAVAGLILRNPPPLRQVMLARFGWWPLKPGTHLLSRQVPPELCAIRNAAAVTAPAVFITAGQDRVVPPSCQQQIAEAYAGPKQVLSLPQADHHTPMSDEELEQYGRRLDWLRQQMMSGLTAP